eukprot:m.72618 g.72618  ORF g.72618 m.72618 type:complete len:191 (-) comp12338_c0_seq4:2086-2658(-)
MASGAKGRPRRVGDSLKQKHMGDSDDYEPHTYHLRVGPNYKRNKKKEAYTGPLLYDFVSLDLFRSNHIVQNNIKYIQLPALPPNRRITNGVPPYLVVTVNLPLYSAGFWPKDDGECFQITAVLLLKESAQEQLEPANISSAPPVFRLLRDFILDEDYRDRFKVRLASFVPSPLVALSWHRSYTLLHRHTS